MPNFLTCCLHFWVYPARGKWFQLHYKPQCGKPKLSQHHELLVLGTKTRQEGASLAVQIAHRARRGLFEVLPLASVGCHAGLACPQGAVCLHSCRLRSTARVVLWHAGTEPVLRLTHPSKPFSPGTSDWERSVDPAQSEASKHHHADWGDGDGRRALPGDGTGQGERSRDPRRACQCCIPRLSSILRDPRWKCTLPPWNVPYSWNGSLFIWAALVTFFFWSPSGWWALFAPFIALPLLIFLNFFLFCIGVYPINNVVIV